MLSDESTLMRSINNASTYGSFYCADPGTIFHMLVSLRWLNGCQRPYRNEYTGSLPNSEVNRCRARSVLGWGTAWEVLWVLLAFLSRSSYWRASGERQKGAPERRPDIYLEPKWLR